jgi:hypothetical protein
MIEVDAKTAIMYEILENECFKAFGKKPVLISVLLPTNYTKSRVKLPDKKEIEGDAYLLKEEADADAIRKALKELSGFGKEKLVVTEKQVRKIASDTMLRLELALFNFSKEKTGQEKALEVLVKAYQAEQAKSSKQIMSLVILSAVMLFCMVVMLFKMR